MTRLTSIECLRGVAALLVLFAHVKFPVIDACGADALPSVLRPMWGACGVDLFFVISGFVIGLTLDRPGMTWRAFLAARVSRVVPIYVLFTIVCLAIPTVLCVRLSPNVAVDSFFYLPLLDTHKFAGTIHPFGWTLSFEIWFYLAAAITAVIAGPRSAPIWLAAIFAVGPLVMFAINYDKAWYFPQFAMSPLVMEFALGCVAYRLTRRPPSQMAGVAVLIAGLIGLVFGSLRADRLAVYSEVLASSSIALERVVCWGVPSFLIVYGVSTIERRTGWWPAQRAATYLGGISFAVYLIQPIVLFAVGSLCQSIGGVTPWVVVSVAFTLVIMAATIIHRTVELPLVAATRRLLERWLSVSRPSRPLPAGRLGLSTV